jgi:hypothetical protein
MGDTIMKSIAIIAAAAAALTPAIAIAREPASAVAATAPDATQQSFVHDGSTYVYTMKFVEGRRVIDGRSYPSGTGFHLVVRGDNVTGTAGGVPVMFRVASARGAAIETAAR